MVAEEGRCREVEAGFQAALLDGLLESGSLRDLEVR
jgi:hypothetical protein